MRSVNRGGMKVVVGGEKKHSERRVSEVIPIPGAYEERALTAKQSEWESEW